MKLLRKRWFVTVASMVTFYIGWILYLAVSAEHPERNFQDALIFEISLVGLLQGPLYLLPTIVGLHKRNALGIFILNLFLGWTGVGWVIALIWAVLKTDPAGENL
jgi:hypothetical protein